MAGAHKASFERLHRMNFGTQEKLPALSGLPALSELELEDASFRAQDRGWAAVVDLYQRREEAEGITYQSLATRVGRKRQQIQRWLTSAFNMNMRSLGLLAEGLNSDVVITLIPRGPEALGRNYIHPSERARIVLAAQPTASAASITSGLTASGTVSIAKIVQRESEDA
jgi:hypothetical protein